MDNNPVRKGSRTYSIKMTWNGNPDAILLEAGVGYRSSVQFLNDLQRTWNKRGFQYVNRKAHDRLTLHKLTVWFEEEKDEKKQTG